MIYKCFGLAGGVLILAFNWTVVKTYPAPGAVFDVVLVASNRVGQQIIAHGFSGRKIDEGTVVRFVSATYQVAPRTQRTISYFVEPIK